MEVRIDCHSQKTGEDVFPSGILLLAFRGTHRTRVDWVRGHRASPHDVFRAKSELRPGTRTMECARRRAGAGIIFVADVDHCESGKD